MATAVDDSATTKPSSTANPVDQPKAMDSNSMTPTEAQIWNPVTSNAKPQILRNERKESSMPTMNSSISTPNSASTSICSRLSTTASADGPNSTPARI